MFAVAHSRSVTLWSTSSLALIHAFPSGSVAPVKKVEFTGVEGTGLMAGGEHGVVGWDLLTFEGEFEFEARETSHEAVFEHWVGVMTIGLTFSS